MVEKVKFIAILCLNPTNVRECTAEDCFACNTSHFAMLSIAMFAPCSHCKFNHNLIEAVMAEPT